MINPSIAPCKLLDPSKLSLANPPWGFCQAIHRVCLWLWFEGGGEDGKGVCESLCLIRHSAFTRFAHKREMPRLVVLLRNILLFRVFKYTQCINTTLSSSIGPHHREKVRP